MRGFDPERRTACRTLRFLGTDVAVDEMIKRYDEEREDGCGFEYMAGLFSAPDRARVVRQMEAGLRANDQPVSEGYLRTLALLSVYVQHPELRSPQTRDTKGRLTPSSELVRLQALVRAATAAYAELLDAALPEKSARARALILSRRLESARRVDPISPHSAGRVARSPARTTRGDVPRAEAGAVSQGDQLCSRCQCSRSSDCTRYRVRPPEVCQDARRHDSAVSTQPSLLRSCSRRTSPPRRRARRPLPTRRARSAAT
jgi:hypothetical protein